jgi:hypothetical protein
LREEIGMRGDERGVEADFGDRFGQVFVWMYEMIAEPSSRI